MQTLQGDQHTKLPELDGVRGIAIVLVMLLHSVIFEPWTIADRVLAKGLGFSWVGVDLFFCLSGFLITGILYDAKGRGRYFTTFFGRRSLRIFPIYFAYLIGLTVFAYLVAPASPASAMYRDTQLWHWLYAVNFLVAGQGDWSVTPLNNGHLWSLAIEEQFYWLWPLAVWALRRRQVMSLAVVLIGAAFLLRLALRLADVAQISVFVLTPTRMDALLAGSFTALLIRGPSTAAQLARFGRLALCVGGALAAAAILFELNTGSDSFLMQTIGFTGVCLLGSSLILHTQTLPVDSLVRRGLRAQWLVFFGTYSYGLYVLHRVAIEWVFGWFPSVESLPTVAGFLFPWAFLRGACAIAVALVFALISWHLMEKHFLAMKGRFVYGARTAAPVEVR